MHSYYKIFILDFRTVQTVWYFFFILLLFVAFFFILPSFIGQNIKKRTITMKSQPQGNITKFN